MKRTLLKILPLLFGISLFFIAGGQGQDPPPAEGPDEETRQKIEACIACHSEEAESGPPINAEKLKQTPHATFSCESCHTSITELPHTPEMTKEKPVCGNCHSEAVEAFQKSTHSRDDYEKNDHPSCVYCHGSGDSHAITAGSKWTREQKVKVCTQCHAQKERMERYKVDPEAVSSYHESFHGKALLRFGNLKTAICTDCHAHHDVLAPMHPEAPTHASNVAKTCGSAECHKGSDTNFALSGANHLRLRIKHDSLLAGVLWFFRMLIIGTIAFMVLSIALDLIKVVYRTKEPPRCGRLAGVFISFSYFSLVTAIVIYTMQWHGARYAAFAAIGFIVLALIAYALRPKRPEPPAPQRMYPRMNLNLRLQHILLFLSVGALTVTGLPLRFASSTMAVQQLELFGGLEPSRLIHRWAAVGLIVASLWHFGYLFLRWAKAGWSFKGWKMLPNKKDLEDFVIVTKSYLGLSKEEPKFDHYTFRSKIDYLAEYWGVPVMVLTGFVLWFPMYFATILPEEAWPIAFIAHGYEATLAFLAVICWHLYNVLFHPNVFPFNRLWLTGKLTREEMEREHPLELERLDAAEASSRQAAS